MARIDGERTRDALIVAAEREMARFGIEGASLTAIHAAAGQRNNSAVNHYFGGRSGLVQAIGVKHRARITPLRHAMLDRIERRGRPTVEALAAAIVEPAATCLADASGRDYLVILAEAAGRHGAAALFDGVDVPHLDSTRRLNNMLLELLDGPIARRRERIGDAVLVATVLLADIAREVERGAISDREVRRRTRSLARTVAAVLLVPPS